ncbi:MAG: ATP-binding protein [Alphaproteobacteria bacterium]
MTSQDEIRLLQRIAQGIEQLGPKPAPELDIKGADAYVWNAAERMLHPVTETQALPLDLLLGIDDARNRLLANTLQFAQGYSANNALLWGARGTGKSSLIKALHAHVNRQVQQKLVLIEVHREDIATLPHLIHALRGWVIRRFIIFCDDLSFDGDDTSYKSLKSVLEGGIEQRPDHILLYATSNRRHLMPREMAENEAAVAIHGKDTQEEKLSLSDRFGLWVGFHNCDEATYIDIVKNYARHYKLNVPEDELAEKASLWSRERGARSGRVAWQFIQDLAGKMKKRVA